MNKIVVDKAKLLVENMQSYLDIKVSNLTINCRGHNLLIIKNYQNCNLNIILEDNSFLDILINSENIGDNKIVITQNNKTQINYYEAFTGSDNINLKITNIFNGNDNISNLNIRCISFKDNTNIEVTAEVLKLTQNNNLTENIKGINGGGKIIVKPNMIINTNEVTANHFVTIGGINKNDLFYLESKGITEDKAKNVIYDGFLKSLFGTYQDLMNGGGKDE